MQWVYNMSLMNVEDHEWYIVSGLIIYNSYNVPSNILQTDI